MSAKNRTETNKKEMNLLEACAMGNLNEIKNICSSPNRLDVNLGDENYWFPIHHAVHFADVECLRVLLKHPRIDTSVKTSDGSTALHIACYIPDIPIQIVQLLVNKDKKFVEWVNVHQVSPLEIAILSERLDIVRLLIEQGNANVNHCDNHGEHALFYAVRAEQLDIIQYLLNETDCKVNLKNESQVNLIDICTHQVYDDFRLKVRHKCAMEVFKFLSTSDLSFKMMAPTLDDCVVYRNHEYLDVIINKFYLNSTLNQRYVSIIQQLLAATNSLEIIWKYMYILPLHESFIPDDKHVTLLYNIMLRRFLAPLCKLFKEDRSLFDVYAPLLLTQIEPSLKKYDLCYADQLIYWREDFDVKISFCTELAAYGFDLNYAFNYLKEVNNKSKESVKLLIRWSTSIQPKFDCRVLRIKKTNQMQKLMNLCRIRIRESVFEANKNLPNYNKILMLNSLPVPQVINNYLRHITNEYDLLSNIIC